MAGPRNFGWFQINNKAATRTTTVDIFDEIGVYGLSAKDFAAQLRDIDADTISLNVNSPGGDVFDGIAILNTLRNHPAKIVATVQGLAASAASFIVQGADEVVMARNSELMIHDAWGLAMGNSADLRDLADRLDKVSDNIADIYAQRAGGDVKAWRKAMRAESWYSADEAVAAGLADRVDGKADDAEGAKAKFDLGRFQYRGRATAPVPFFPRPAALAVTADGDDVIRVCTECGNDEPTEGHSLCSDCLEASEPSPMPPAEQLAEPLTPTEGDDAMSDTLVQGLRDRLGIPAEADLDEGGLLSALDEALAEQTTTPAPAASITPEGTVLVDSAEYQNLITAAAMGREARERQIADERSAVVNQAVSEGRIPPARREHWLAQLAADPGAADVLNSLAKGTVPLVAAGYTGGVVEAHDDDDDLYNRLFSKEA